MFVDVSRVGFEISQAHEESSIIWRLSFISSHLAAGRRGRLRSQKLDKSLRLFQNRTNGVSQLFE